MPTAIVSDLIYFHPDELDMTYVEDNFYYEIFQDGICYSHGKSVAIQVDQDYDYSSKRCPYIHNRPNDVCLACPVGGLKGIFKFARWKKIDGEDMLGLYKGNLDYVDRACDGLDRFELDDRRSFAPSSGRLQFTAELRPEQAELAQYMMREDFGLGIAPPRTGKTVLAIYLACKLGLRTCIMAHQEDLLQQFYDTIMGTADKPPFTNAPELFEQGHTPVVLAQKTKDYFTDADIVLTTYQKLMSDAHGKKRLADIREMFGMIIIDEIHKGPAPSYSNVLSYLAPSRLYGLTATPRRKDGLEFVVDRIVGQIIHEVRPETLVPNVRAELLDLKCKDADTLRTAHTAYNHVIKRISQADRALDYIAAQAVEDIMQGYRVLITSQSKPFTYGMCKRINELWYEHEDGDDDEVALPFNGDLSKAKRPETLRRASAEEIGCIVAMRQMLTGINVPPWSVIYEVFPMNNAPNFEQEVKRICTPMKGKPNPVVKFFVDLRSKRTAKWYSATFEECRRMGFTIESSASDLYDTANYVNETGDTLPVKEAINEWRKSA